MKLKELETIVFRASSNLMKVEGKNVFNKGLVTSIKGKKIENIYHIYGTVSNKTKTQEFASHVKINLLKKNLEGIRCTCDDFRELSSSGHLFMCSHLTATAYSFFSITTKNEAEKPTDNSLSVIEKNSITKLVHRVAKDSIYFEGFSEVGNEKIKVKPLALRDFLENLQNKKIKFVYDHLEAITPILHKDLPLTFNLKSRGNYFILTTHRQFPISLNSKNDVYLFNRELYLPSKGQIDKYIPLCEKLKKHGEILYHKNIDNYNKITSLLSNISKNINLSEDVKLFAANFLKPEIFLYEEGSLIYCDINLLYGKERINLLKDDKRKAALVRDYDKEEKLLLSIESYSFIKRNHRLIFVGGDEELFNILTKSDNSVHSLGTVILGDSLKERKIYSSTSLEATLSEEENYYKLSCSIGDIDIKELNSMLTCFRLKNRFYRTKNNGFLDFEEQGVKSFFNLIELFSNNGNVKDGILYLEKNKALFFGENIKKNKLDFINGMDILSEIQSKFNNICKSDILIPENLQGELREYQIDGYRWIKTLSQFAFGGILADEMGLGKTIQTIAFLLSEKGKKSIIICPTSLIYNWKEEIEKFAPSLSLGVLHGVKSERVQLINKLNEYDVILTTYGTLRMDMQLYGDVTFDFCVIDEGQNIKNHLALNTKVIKMVKAKVKFALTGTPMENNLMELWSIFDFIMPGYLYSKKIFEEKFINAGEAAMDDLRLLIKPFILRRTKKQVMKELPDKIEKKFLVEMTPDQKIVYESYLKQVRDIMIDKKHGKIEVFSYLTKLRQICLDPTLILQEYEGGSGKTKVAMDLIKDHIEYGGKILLFSQFTSVLNKLGENLKSKGTKYLNLDGSTKPKDRIEMVKEFNNNEAVKVFLISLKAGGTGLNLTSATLVIHFDPWWNLAVENQATDRAHRIGQRNVVEVIKLVAKGTIEEKILLLQENKRNLIDSVITGELQNSNSLNKLSKEELELIFYRD